MLDRVRIESNADPLVSLRISVRIFGFNADPLVSMLIYWLQHCSCEMILDEKERKIPGNVPVFKKYNTVPVLVFVSLPQQCCNLPSVRIIRWSKHSSKSYFWRLDPNLLEMLEPDSFMTNADPRP
jgi:hypothetical protein